MTGPGPTVSAGGAGAVPGSGRPRPDHPYRAEIEAERRGWYELADLVRSLSPEECLVAGYYVEPDWTVRDLVAHIGPWLAEAEVQLERLNAGTYEGHDVDIDALNAVFREALRDQPWDVAWVQASAGRTRMIEAWYALREESDEAAWWIRRSGPEHYLEHLERLRAWVDELIGRRPAASEPIPPDADGSEAIGVPEVPR